MAHEWVHFEGTAMKYRRFSGHLVFERNRGWITTNQLRPGDHVSIHTYPPRFYKVAPPPEDS